MVKRELCMCIEGNTITVIDSSPITQQGSSKKMMDKYSCNASRKCPLSDNCHYNGNGTFYPTLSTDMDDDVKKTIKEMYGL